jgi:VWFA-related protein
VDIIQLDVTVLGRDRTPITDLSVADFTVLENGKPRPIQAFSSVDLPPAPPPLAGPAGWRTEVPADVVTNQVSPSRIVVLLIDDHSVVTGGTATAGSWAVARVRETARTLIAQLDPTDLAAVVFTSDNRAAQSLTLDRRRLRAAIERSAIFPGSSIDDEGDAESTASQRSASQTVLCPLCAVRALRQVTEALQAFPDRRKDVIFISRGFLLIDSEEVRIFTEAMRLAQAANIAIHPMDPAGLLTYASTAQSRVSPGSALVSTIKRRRSRPTSVASGYLPPRAPALERYAGRRSIAGANAGSFRTSRR